MLLAVLLRTIVALLDLGISSHSEVSYVTDAFEVAAGVEFIRDHCYGGVSRHICPLLRCCRWEVGVMAHFI
ncbi:hypothetical protein RB195_002134 [Necator americanus]|uniref:Secreted protein n=1 Tax=Necator americanus TaxID=51031 RepID=A0ABR1DJ19_NECAM